MDMGRLQDLEGYPDKLNIQEILDSDFDRSDIRDWAIDLLAAEAEPWLDYEDQTTADFALAIVASCRPLMEVMAASDVFEGDEEVLKLAINSHLALSKTLAHLRHRGIELGVREE
jgi:hypothetical protein